MLSRKCESCHKDVSDLYVWGYENFTRVTMLNRHWIGAAVCHDCQAKYISDHTKSCSDCGGEFVDDFTASIRCDKCQVIYTKRSRIVSGHKQRAIEKGFESTLDAYGWIKTLEHYKHKCVYCGKRYEVLDHYIPVAKGGGTSAKNCVPACWKCNSQKSAKMPRDFTTDRKADEIELYLSGLQ